MDVIVHDRINNMRRKTNTVSLNNIISPVRGGNLQRRLQRRRRRPLAARVQNGLRLRAEHRATRSRWRRRRHPRQRPCRRHARVVAVLELRQVLLHQRTARRRQLTGGGGQLLLQWRLRASGAAAATAAGRQEAGARRLRHLGARQRLGR